MPSSITSPPPLRGSASRSPDMMRSPPPVPFALPSAYMIRSPRQRSTFSPASSPVPISRSPSATSSSSSGSNYSQQVATPPARSKRDRLLPAIPLSIETHHPKPKRSTPQIDFHAVAQELVGSIVLPEITSKRHSGRRQASHISSPELSPCPRRSSNSPSALGPESTPPRPRRRRASGSESLSDLLAPRPAYARAASPASVSTTNSTISALSEAPTPKARHIPDRPAPPPPHSGTVIPDRSASLPNQELGTPLAKKRDSTQRRLSALRGLVVDLDFNQHWSLAETSASTDSDPVEEIFWACGEPIPSDASDISISDSEFSIIDTTMRPRRNTESTPPFVSNSQLASPPMDVTPARPTARRLPSSTPPRRPRLFRSSSDLHSKTPDPPRPASRQCREFTGVASSGYSKCFDRASSPEELTPPLSTWRACLSSDRIHDDLLRHYGPLEVKRQEIIWEMCETEKSFVKSMKTVLRLFATPLKTPQGKWIQGISERITELFDLLECVVQVHSSISAAERDLRRTDEVVNFASFVGMFKSWVERLKVHEYYLLRFEAVVQLVEDNVRDADSVFGEFVRMQMKEEVLGSMSLGSMLLKPVQRLTKYPLFLKRLLDVTPHPHPSQPDILSLLTKTESIILTLQATKAREDDLYQLEHLESRISGLPQGFKLAIPGRKLLGHGQVIRITPKEGSPATPRSRAGSIHSSRGSISSTVSSSVSPWSDGSRISNFSTSSCSSYGPPPRSNSLVQDHGSGYSPRDSPSVTSVTRSPSTASASSIAISMLSTTDWRPPTPSSVKSGTSSASARRKEDGLVMLIFDDVVLVGQAISDRGLFKKRKEGDKLIKLLSGNEGGVGKVMDVRDWSGWQGHSALFTLSVISPSTPSEPITNAFSVPPNPSSPVSKLKGDKNVLGPSITSLSQFITTLCQATSTPVSDDGAEDGGMGVLTEYLAE